MLGELGSQIMAWTFIVAILTDVLDGYIARSWKMVTRLGKLLDPLADKLLVTTALIMMLAVGRLGVWEAGMVVVIVARELAVTGLRGIASAEGHIVACLCYTSDAADDSFRVHLSVPSHTTHYT